MFGQRCTRLAICKIAQHHPQLSVPPGPSNVAGTPFEVIHSSRFLSTPKTASPRAGSSERQRRQLWPNLQPRLYSWDCSLSLVVALSSLLPLTFHILAAHCPTFVWSNCKVDIDFEPTFNLVCTVWIDPSLRGRCPFLLSPNIELLTCRTCTL